MEMKFEDKLIVCRDCGPAFLWSADDRRFYKSKNLLPVKRCPDCRARRKATIVQRDGGGNG